MKIFRKVLFFILIFTLGFFSYEIITKVVRSNLVLRQVIARLEADTRIAEVLVTGVNYDERTERTSTTIKFLEYGVGGSPLEPRYFTFDGNIIQFQSLVIRFDDKYVKKGDRLRGKSIYLFWKVFMLDGPNTQEYVITELDSVPDGYAFDGGIKYQKDLWREFWEYALSPEGREASGVKNAQIEAPGTMFVPGVLYTLKIEHDGGIRIDTSRLPRIMEGENIPHGQYSKNAQ
jgi:hypothetical protein